MQLSTTRVCVFAAVLTLSVTASSAHGHYRPGSAHNVVHAARGAWCGHQYRKCQAATEALAVARCESGYNPRAKNGQYLGIWQMGLYARSTFGHGPDPWRQARAAYRYWKVAGWSPWQCSPWGGLRW